ncbi:hypothetical protein CMV_018963 [Castanea mollissima]|uniref:Uncharacterized protein n=1 Tax=Castanea mollissima TaxID=60419 RepID=A0A8J4VN81_9ROSI|nr:hypothetical protein CMV_018963 [Castanea mollissima]
MWIIHFNNSINTRFPIRIPLREANWSDHRPRFKATVNFNGKELLAASSVRAIDIYIHYKGDQRKNVSTFLVQAGIVKKEHIKIHCF